MYKLIGGKSLLRLGFADSTDISPYSNIYEGSILNVIINICTQTTILYLATNKMVIRSIDHKELEHFDSSMSLPINNKNYSVKGIDN